MIAGVYISQEMFANGILTALKRSLEHDRKHVLRLLRLHALDKTGFDNKHKISKFLCHESNTQKLTVSALGIVKMEHDSFSF